VIEWIRELTAAKLPPTPSMITQFVENLVEHTISRTWVTRFIKRREKELCGKWLPGIDRTRVIAELDQACYEIWYSNVSVLLRS
jgi:hypothetical protein